MTILGDCGAVWKLEPEPILKRLASDLERMRHEAAYRANPLARVTPERFWSARSLRANVEWQTAKAVARISLVTGRWRKSSAR